MYSKVETNMDFVSREKAVAQMWKEKDIIRKSYHHRDGAERFTFFDPVFNVADSAICVSVAYMIIFEYKTLNEEFSSKLD